jgi:ribA/ribD-fused uncharacterized protein
MAQHFITFTKVNLPYGFLGNMAPYQVNHLGKSWRTTEALFQALRFDDEAVREAIRAERSPMAAKFVAKTNRDKMVVEPGSEQDLDNMRLVLRLKVQQHPSVRADLMATEDAVIIEDCTKRRASIWGMRYVGGAWVGDNFLGKLWMELREELRMDARQILNEALDELDPMLRHIERLRITPSLDGTILSVCLIHAPNASEHDFEDRGDMHYYEYQVDLEEPDGRRRLRNWLETTLGGFLH